jgi:hypothetical protein
MFGLIGPDHDASPSYDGFRAAWEVNVSSTPPFPLERAHDIREKNRA